jgi:uncharacterized protein YjdB
VRKVLFGSLVSLLLLTIVACGSGRFGDNSNGKTDFGVNKGSINSIGGIGGDSSAVKPSNTSPQATDVTVSSLSPAMAVDGTMQFTATIKDANHEATRWTSSEPSVATIDDSGVATGMGAGTTQITATAGGKTSPPVALTLCDYRHI